MVGILCSNKRKKEKEIAHQLQRKYGNRVIDNIEKAELLNSNFGLFLEDEPCKELNEELILIET